MAILNKKLIYASLCDSVNAEQQNEHASVNLNKQYEDASVNQIKTPKKQVQYAGVNICKYP